MSCPNINSPQWKELVDRIGVREAYREWAKYGGDIPDANAYPESFMGTNATLKVIGALSSPKMDAMYTKFFGSNKDKFYSELMNNGATKEQVKLLREWNEKNPTTNISDMLAGIAAEMSYTVEINVAMEDSYQDEYEYLNDTGVEVSMQDMQEAYGRDPTDKPTQHYSGLTVAGGTNYRENEIRTPDITPVRKGHAAFATGNGIGWFRSDDRRIDDNSGKKVSDGVGGLVQLGQVTDSKTRRILELQSDLFQKERDKNNLADIDVEAGYKFNTDKGEIEVTNILVGTLVVKNLTTGKSNQLSKVDFANLYKEKTGNSITRGSDFLQLLNKDNNWVTFFVKSIIQDSTRKGYENVLFPAGATASKIEGHETLEQFLVNAQRNIDSLQERLEPGGLDNWFNFKLQSIQNAARSNRENMEEKPVQLYSSREHSISPATVNSEYNFVRIRENNRYDPEGRLSYSLTGDESYKGWVLYEYTVGAGNRTTKLTDQLAQELLNRNNERLTQMDREHAEQQEANAAHMIANKENIQAEERNNVQRNIDHTQQEMEDARAGRTQLSSIANFYENTIQNILSKQKFSPERITDEYGNEWFKVKLKDDYKDTIYFNKQESPASFEKRATQFLQKEGLITQDKQKGWVISNGDGNSKVVSVISNNYEKIQQIGHNYAEKFGFNPIDIIHDGKDYVVKVNGDSAAVFQRDSRAIEAARQTTMDLLTHLSEKTGLPFEIITDEQSNGLLGDEADDNVRGFYKDGKVYMLEGHLTPDIAFHEYAHPFISSLRLANPSLHTSLLVQLRNSPEGEQLYQSVLQSKDYSGLTKDQLHDEVLVRALTAVAQGDLAFVSPEGKGFWSKLWFGIKQFFRKVFGQNVQLDNLSETTTLNDLSKMLLGDKGITFGKDQEDNVLFNRDIAKEMDEIPEHDSLKAIEVFHRVAQDHLVKMRENHNYSELRDVLKNQADGSILTDINKLLSLSKEKEDELDNNFKKLNNFARAVVGARILSEKMKEHVLAISEDKSIDEKDKLRTMRYYSFMSNDWLQAFEQLREINAHDLPLLGDEINRATNNFNRINDHIAKAFKGGLVVTLREQLAPLNEAVQRDLGPELEKVKKEVEGGNTKLQKRLDYLQKMYDHGTFTDEKILKLLQGELGDTNWFSSMLESYTSSPDPIVGGFASYLNKEMYKVEAGIQEFSTTLGNELAPLYKQLGVDISRPEDLGKQLVFRDTAFTKGEDGQPKGHEVHTFLHEFANGYQYDYQNLQHQIDEAKEGGDKDKTIKLQQEFNQLRKDYFHREYVDEVYNVKEFWNESDINRLAQQRRKEITDQLAGYEAESGFKDLTKEDLDHIDELLTQLKTLSSTKNLDGSDKVGDDLGVAQAIKEYNQKMMQYREEMPMKGAFERDLQTQKDDLLDKGFTEDSKEYKDGLNGWLKQNLRVRLSDNFYDSRNRITDEIAQIVGQLSQDQIKQLDVSKAWKEMFEQIKGFRDQDNQPVGTSLSGDKVREVKKLQEKIDDINNTLRRLNGLTNEEQSRYSELWGKLVAGMPLDHTESAEFDELVNRKKLLGISQIDKARLMGLFEELKEFQSKIPTEYYIQAFNQKLQEANMTGEVDMTNSDAYLDAQAINPFLEANPDNPFVKWFLANHISKVKWDTESQQNKQMYERLYIWNRIVPNDEKFKSALATNNYQALLDLKNPMVSIRPASKYFFYRIKNEFRTKREVGKTVDNRGNWLPRTMEQGAKDGKYINKQYYDLRNSRDPKQKTLYNILETYKKYHLKAQEDSPKYGRLWYELPRVRKEKIENLEALVTSPLKAAKNIISWAGAMFSTKAKADAFDQDLVSKKDLQNEHKLYVATDLFGNEINSIPMKYMSKLDANEVSMDIGRSVTKYALGLQINKALHEINPFAQALQQTLAQEGIKSVNKISTRNWSSKFANIPVLDRSNVRLQTINNMIERDIEGVENKMELGLFGSKVAQHIMGISAFGSLALNLPAGIKNVVVAKLQNLSEANSNEFFGVKNLAKADGIFMKRFMPKLIHDYNSFSNRSLETQMFELFDFVQGKFEEHVGESFSASYKKDIAKLRFTHSFQVLGELQAQGQAGIAMMLKQQVPWTHEGTTTMINYLDAWELKDGVIQLKDGVDKSWGKNGDNFASFKLKMHKINELMQGAYSKMNQSEATRYTAFKMINFMRRYLVPGIVNRFTVNRNNVALGTQREGFYMTTARLGLDMIKTGFKNWHIYSDKEKRNIYKTLTEIGYSVGFLALISMMGYNQDDPDKNKKLKDQSWAHNMALYELVMIKGEIENFIPIPGMGINEILRMKDQPSIAFPLLNKYYKIVSHLLDLVQQPFTDYDITHYKRSTGIYDKGDLKIYSDILKAIGYTGATLHPDVAVKNYMATTNRYN